MNEHNTVDHPGNGSAPIGARLRAVRKRRGLTQAGLAELSGVSLSLIRKLEQGEREDARIETLRRLAVTLDVRTTALVSSTPPEEDRAAGNWDRVRDAILESPAPAQDDEPVSAADYARVFADAVTLYQDHRYDELARLLPPLLAAGHDTDLLLRSRAFGLAGSVLIQTRHRETAARALDIAMGAANGSQMDAAAVVNTRCWLLILERRYAEVEQLAVGWADKIEPRLSAATPLQLSAWGCVLLRGSAAAIRDNRPGEADDMMRLAQAAATVMRPGDPPHPYWNLGNLTPSVVTMKRAENALIAGYPDVTLRLAERVPHSLRSMDNRNRHLLDVSAAHLDLRRYDEAFGVLVELHGDAGPWLAEQRMARDLLARIIDHRRTLTPEMRELAAAVRLEL
jgi:transcriptional regulator with XRE-family HTH domain